MLQKFQISAKYSIVNYENKVQVFENGLKTDHYSGESIVVAMAKRIELLESLVNLYPDYSDY